MARPKKKQELHNNSLLDWVKNNGDRLDELRVMLSTKAPQDTWRGMLSVPPGSLMEQIIGSFSRYSDIPLEIPFFQLFHLISGFLLYNDINLKINDGTFSTTIKPDFWTLLLCSSGGGKTFSWNRISEIAPDIVHNIQWTEYNGLVSGAAYADSLRDNNNKLVVKDEFEHFYRRMKNDNGPMAEMIEYMLLTYDNAPISRRRKRGGKNDDIEEYIEVLQPAITFLAMSVTETFCKHLTIDEILNGWFARWAIAYCDSDPTRNGYDFPMYKIDLKPLRTRFEGLLNSISHKEYLADEDALSGYYDAWKILSNDRSDNLTFFRRLLWKAHKYALVYHILTERGNDIKLTRADYGWAARAIQMHICDNARLLHEHGMSDLQKKLEKIERFYNKCIENGKRFTPSDVVRNVRGFASVAEVKSLMSLIPCRR